MQLPYLDQITFVPQEDGAEAARLARGRRLPDDRTTSGPLQIVQIRDDVEERQAR